MENEGLNLDGVAITCGLIMGAIASVGGYSSPPLGAAIVTYVFVYGIRKLVSGHTEKDVFDGKR